MQKTAATFFLLKYTITQILGLNVDYVEKINDNEFKWVNEHGLKGSLSRSWNGSWNVMYDDKVQYPIESNLVDLVTTELNQPPKIIELYNQLSDIELTDWKIRSKVIFHRIKSIVEEFLMNAPNHPDVNGNVNIDTSQLFFTKSGKFMVSLN